jgi:hypothetical protein
MMTRDEKVRNFYDKKTRSEETREKEAVQRK